jgi:choloylglycine hydrolase
MILCYNSLSSGHMGGPHWRGKNSMSCKHLIVVVLGLTGLLFSGSMATPADATIPSGSRACTSFSLDNGGANLFGTNYDNTIAPGLLFVNKRGLQKTGWESGTTGEVATWVSNYGSVSVNVAGYQLAWAGMNEQGLMISTMALGETENPLPDERPPLDSGFWLQYQLDTAATIEDVVASEDDVRMTETVDHYLVCDKTECAVIEFLEGEMVVHAGEDLPMPVLTNTPYASALDTWQSNTREEIEQAGNYSRLRFAIAADRVTGFDTAGEAPALDYAFETLHLVSDAYDLTSPTQWSVVFDPATLTLYFRTRNNPDIRYASFDDLDFSCRTSVQMLDAHAELSGDVSGDFVEYDHEVSLEHTLNFLEQWGQRDIPDETIEQLLRLFASFPCTE